MRGREGGLWRGGRVRGREMGEGREGIASFEKFRSVFGCPSVCLSHCLSVIVCVCVCVFVCIYVCVCLSVCLSVFLFVCVERFQFLLPA